MAIHMKGLSKVELVQKISMLINGMKSEENDKFSFKANWNEDGMRIVIGIEGIQDKPVEKNNSGEE